MKQEREKTIGTRHERKGERGERRERRKGNV